MKKFRLLFPLISLIVLSGCGVPKIDKALENSRSLSSYTMTIESKQNGVTSNSVIEVDSINAVSKQTSSITSDDISKDIIVYSEIVDGKFVSYTKGLLGDDWYVAESEVHSIDDEKISGIFYIGETEFKKVKSSKGLYKYEVNKDLINFGYGDFKCYVYTDGEYIVKIELVSEEPEFNETISFSNINKTEVVVPDEVKESAKKLGEVDFSNIDTSIIDDFDLSSIDGFDNVTEYFNSDDVQSKLEEAKGLLQSEDVQKQIDEAQKAIQSEDVQKQIKEAQERAKSLLGN